MEQEWMNFAIVLPTQIEEVVDGIAGLLAQCRLTWAEDG